WPASRGSRDRLERSPAPRTGAGRLPRRPRVTTLGRRPRGQRRGDAVAPVVVRRNLVWPFLVGVLALAVAVGYLWRAAGPGTPWDWLLGAVAAAVAAGQLRGAFDARTPLLLVDDLGVRIRAGRHWCGLRWEALEGVVL